MEIKIQNKFNIGDIVQRYVPQIVYDNEIDCPICKGNYKISNPNFDMINDRNEFLYCNCCTQGKIQINSRIENVLAPELYKIENIYICIGKTTTSHRYQLLSSPDLNDGAGYLSTAAEESELEAYTGGDLHQ